jgi:hypothetical protein
LRLPDFIAVGPVRTGTTWLDGLLRGRVGLPAGIKEPQFFGWRYELGLAWYTRHFRNCREVVVGEFGPTYFFAGEARERIARHIPDCRIIITLRDPVERIYSHYKLWRKLAIVKGSFAQEIESNASLYTRIAYAPHVRAWRERFGTGHTLVLIYEHSLADRQAYVDRLCAFIGIAPFDLRTVARERRAVAHFERAPGSYRRARRAREFKDALEVRSHLRLLKIMEPMLEWCMDGGDRFPPLDRELAARLREGCAPDIAELEDLLERDLTLWRRPSHSAAGISEGGRHGSEQS